MTLKLRPEQEAIILGYTGGKIGIAAVPGSDVFLSPRRSPS